MPSSKSTYDLPPGAPKKGLMQQLFPSPEEVMA